MKKTACLLLLLGLLLIPMHVCAAENGIYMKDANAAPGETVYFTISVLGSAAADTAGISYTYNETLLEILPDQCSWLRESVLDDFNTDGKDGVWAAKAPADLEGDLCVLAFRVRPDAVYTETEVSCKVILKNGSQVLGQWETTASLRAACSHSYGNWTGETDSAHFRVCTKCGAHQSQSHTWDTGTVSANPENPGVNIRTRTCTLCGKTRTEKTTDPVTEIQPVVPEETEFPKPTKPEEERPQPSYPSEPRETEPIPTSASRQPEEKPEQPSRKPTEPAAQETRPYIPQPKDYNRQETEPKAQPDAHEGHNHSHAEDLSEESRPMMIPVEEVPLPTQGEREASQTASQGGGGKGVMLLLALAAVIGITILIIHKRRK